MHGSAMQGPKSGHNPNVQAQNSQIVYEHKRLHSNKKGLGNATPYEGALTDSTTTAQGASQAEKSTLCHLTPSRGGLSVGCVHPTTKGRNQNHLSR